MNDYPVNVFKASENKVRELNGKKIGETIRAILNVKCIEKTRSFTVVKIGHVSVMQTKRMF